jgi:hypothetical protein
MLLQRQGVKMSACFSPFSVFMHTIVIAMHQNFMKDCNYLTSVYFKCCRWTSRRCWTHRAQRPERRRANSGQSKAIISLKLFSFLLLLLSLFFVRFSSRCHISCRKYTVVACIVSLGCRSYHLHKRALNPTFFHLHLFFPSDLFIFLSFLS